MAALPCGSSPATLRTGADRQILSLVNPTVGRLDAAELQTIGPGLVPILVP